VSTRDSDRFFCALLAAVVILGLAAWLFGCAPTRPAYPGCSSEGGAYVPAVPDWRGGWRDCAP